MLEIANATLAYGVTAAFTDVSLSVAEGSVTCVIGPNGAGKSSLLKAICGWERLRAGAISFLGDAIGGLSPEQIARRGLTLVPEGRHIFQTLTVRENLAVPSRARSSPHGDGLDLALETFPILRERLDQPAGLLSGGEQQQLAIARALVMRPRLIMVDEPSLGLAPMMIEKVYEVFRRLHAEGITLLIVEQSVSRVLSLASRAYLMSSGRLVRGGTPAAIAAAMEESYFGRAE